MTTTRARILTALTLAALLAAGGAQAQIQTFQTGNWNVGPTWVGGVVPTSGDVVINAGHTVTLTTANQIAAAVSLTVNGVLRLGNLGQTVSVLNGSGVVTKNTGADHKILTVGSAATSTFSGVINVTGGTGKLFLTKAGAGTLTLTGDNAYTGDTTVNGGTLRLSGANTASGTTINAGRIELVGAGVLGSGPLALAAGTTLDLSERDVTLALAASQGLTARSGAALATDTGKGLTLGSASPLHLDAFDGATPPLTVSGGGTLTLQSGNTVTITVAGETPLAAGDYTVIAGGVAGDVPSGYPAVIGAGRAVNTTASLLLDDGDLVLRIADFAPVHAPTDIATQAPGGEWYNAATWLGGVIPGPGDRVTISNDVTLRCGAFGFESVTVTNNAALTFQNWQTHLTATNVTLSGGTLTTAGPFNSYVNAFWPSWLPSNRVAITCETLTISQNSAIDVSGQGYLGGYYDWPGNAFIAAHGPGGPAAGRYVGGSHAAAGGRGGAAPYGDPLQPVQPGSGGGIEFSVRDDPTQPGQAKGHGGGIVDIVASGTITVDGAIRADGRDGTYSCGGGAGGSIRIQCAAILGNGRVSADGGKGASASQGAGSGGRIAIYYHPATQSSFPPPALAISSGTRPSNTSRTLDALYNSRIGSVVVPDFRFLTSPIRHSGAWRATTEPEALAFDALTVTNVWLFLDQGGLKLDVTNALQVKDGGRLEWTNAAVTCGSLLLDNFGALDMVNGGSFVIEGHAALADDSYLRVRSAPTNGLPYGSLVDVGLTLDISDNAWIIPISDPTNGGSPKFIARNAVIGTGSGFDANGTGFRNLAGVPYGPGKATGTWGGGGYGGAGGGANGGPSYGSSNATPLQCGSAGGGSSTQTGMHGGGLIWLQVFNELLLNGTFSANGANGSQYGSGGSGGGIYIRTVRFGGSGTLSANGGNGGTDNRTGGGGGGRIHVARVRDVVNTVVGSVQGGHDNEEPKVYGADGTVQDTWLPPVEADIEMRPATNVTATSGNLNAFLVTTGASDTVVFVYWGETDGGTDAAAWARTNEVGVATSTGMVSEVVALDPGREYFYRCAASNDAGFVWAEGPSEYLLSDGVTITFAPAAVSEAGGVATATVSRSSSVTSAAVTVSYMIGGTAVNGTDYTTINDQVTLAAGASNAVVTLTAIPDAGSSDNKSVTLTLTGGLNYALGAPAEATLTITSAEVAASNTSVADGDWHDAAIWSEGHVPVTPQAIMVTNHLVLTRDTEALSSLALDGGGITFSNWTTRLIASNVVLNAGTITCAGPFNSYVNAVWPVLEPSNRVQIVCENLTVVGGAAITVNGKGYRAGYYDGSTYYAGHGEGGGARWMGASHAATGGANNPKAPHGDPLNPMTPGSGGGPEHTSNGGNPGHGGGVIDILAAETVTVDGEISADGVTGTINNWGAGAGGSIRIRCRRIAGNGSVAARGGAAGSNLGGSGSGGRIAVYYDPVEQAAHPVPGVALSARSLTSLVRTYTDAKNSRIGTVVVSDDFLLTSPIRHDGVWMPTNPAPALAFGTLEADDAWIRIDATDRPVSVTGALRVQNGARIEFVNAAVTCGGMTVTNFGVFEMYGEGAGNPSLSITGDAVLADDSLFVVFSGLTEAAGIPAVMVDIQGRFDLSDNAWVYPWSHATNGGSAKFTMETLVIAPDSGFNAVGRGYQEIPGMAYGGPGGGGNGYAGGGYGGRGGGVLGGGVYGDEQHPAQCGSAGGAGSPYGAHGGGLIWLSVGGRLILNGTLNASGRSGTLTSSSYGTGGAGGGIYVSCRALDGTSGSLVANGGNGGTNNRGGGGGGRIAVWRTHHTYTGDYPSVAPGAGHSTIEAQEGTVYWGDIPPRGTLLILR